MAARFCVIIPAYNEGLTIAATILDYKKSFPEAVFVVVDNNSSDDTTLAANNALDHSSDLLLFEKRQGKGAAVKTGLSRVCADVYILVDGDGTYQAQDTARLVDIFLAKRVDMVVGDRVTGGNYQRQNSRAGHSAGNRFLTAVISQLAGQNYADVLSGLRVMSRPFVNMLDVRSAGFELETELNVRAAYLKADVIEVPIGYRTRPEGSVSKLNTIRDGIRILSFALINWISFFPLQSFGLLAAFALTISAVLGFQVFKVFIEVGGMPYPSTAVAAASAGLVGLQALFSGLILRVIMSSRRRNDIANLLNQKRIWNQQLDA